MNMTLERAKSFKRDVEEKIETVLDEFAGGDISREHFDIVYARYSRQHAIAEEALENGELGNLQQIMNEIPTMALHAAIRGKSLGMSVIHHMGMSVLRMFGDYVIEDAYIDLIIDDLKERQQTGNLDYASVTNTFGNTWMIVNSLENSTLITVFRNEPAAKQVQELVRRHRDFESANRNILNQPHPDPETLVYPVELFVNQSH